jgi:hypothetical protein
MHVPNPLAQTIIDITSIVPESYKDRDPPGPNAWLPPAIIFLPLCHRMVIHPLSIKTIKPSYDETQVWNESISGFC